LQAQAHPRLQGPPRPDDRPLRHGRPRLGAALAGARGGGCAHRGNAAPGVRRHRHRQAGRGCLERAGPGPRCMTDPAPRVTVVIPAYNEGDQIIPILDRLIESVTLPCEVLVVVDMPEDSTVAALSSYVRDDRPIVRTVVNTYGRGPANAIRFGIDAATAPVVVVTMADGCDDARQIDELVRLVERGVAVAAASRYMPGGQQVGGPLLKGTLSRLAGRSLRTLAHVGTRDATNSFKAYSTEFVR